ncbi:MAG: PqqD family peptide modification chaperone [Candidatus Omnitrophota bacterium]
MKKSHPVRNPDTVVREEEKEALLFNPADGNMMCINKTGILVWGLSDGSHTVDDIVGEITNAYDVSTESAGKDCLTYLKELENSGFLGYAV